MATQVWRHTRVVKKYSPTQSGARKLALRYGPALVCVRHRYNREGTVRYTTIELMVEETPIIRRKPPDQLLAVSVRPRESALRQKIIAHGGRWDLSLGAWWITRRSATQLQLLERVIAEDLRA